MLLVTLMLLVTIAYAVATAISATARPQSHARVPPTDTFPIGWFSSAVMGTTESFPPPPFNVVVKYWNNNPPENGTSAVLRYLDQAHSRGVNVVLELPHRWVVTSGCATGPCVHSISAVVATACSHPALSGWYMADEPDTRRAWIAPATLTTVADAVRSAESHAGCTARPIAAAFATLQEPGNTSVVSHYNKSVDIYMWDKYPCRDSVPGWHAVAGTPFGGSDFASFPAQMRNVRTVAPQFKSFWFVMQGSIIDSAEDHGHWCNASKCWSAGWRECYELELRNQVYAGLLSGMRGIMFYRLGLLGWDLPGNAGRAALNRSWVDMTLLPVLDEVTPHLPSILRGALVGDDGAPLPNTNVSETIVSARLYEDKPRSKTKLLIALRWNDARSGSRDGGTTVAFELGPEYAEHKALVLNEKGATTGIIDISDEGRLVGTLQRPGAVNVYRIVGHLGASSNTHAKDR